MNPETELVSFLQSSQDPTVIANKVRGAILGVSFLIIAGAAAIFHLTVSSNDVIQLATELGTIAGAAWTIYGCILHLITWAGTVEKQ